ncbi:hypothetical protein [Paenibacillus sp. FSL P4-0288]|uniref:hypothetical protein n=1 Tax=Paenibacillus sp. FSL P4-0288 TaxID=2921633 RepID=UPI0030FA284C
MNYHHCQEMIEAITKLVPSGKLEIYTLNGIPNLEVMIRVDDSSFGPQEDSVYIEIKNCPFCGRQLMNTV